MEDQLVTQDTATLAKNKGYNIYSAKCPTQCSLQRWLREVHKYHLQIEYDFTNNTFAYHGFDYVTVILPMDYMAEREIGGNFIYSTYEEALEQGLYQALKLIP